MSEDIVRMYLNDIGKHPLLTAEDERKLAQNIEIGNLAQERIPVLKSMGALVMPELSEIDLDEARSFLKEVEANPPTLAITQKAQRLSPYLAALRELTGEADARQQALAEARRDVSIAARSKDRFINSNLRLVVSIARRYPLPNGMDFLDLVQEGNLGLEHAVDKYDWQRGFKFSTYATFWIRQAIGRALDQKASLIRIQGDRPARLRSSLRAAAGDVEQLTDEEAELHRVTNHASLDKTVGEGEGTTMGDLMASPDPGPEEQVLSDIESELLDELLATLDERARYAIRARFGLDTGERQSFREVGESLGVTAEAARRLISRAIAGLRNDAERILDESGIRG